MKERVVVFAGNDCKIERQSHYFKMAYATGQLLAGAGFTVITGGGSGLMDETLRGAIEAGGKTIGVALDFPGRKQSVYVHTSELFSTLGPRQNRLISLGDAYIALPGGIGTFYEVNTILALKRVNELPPTKPLVLVGSNFHPLNLILEQMEREGFVNSIVWSYFSIVQTPEEAIHILKNNLRVEGLAPTLFPRL